MPTNKHTMKGKYELSETDSAEYFGKEIKNVSRTTVGAGRIYGRVILPQEWIGKKVLCLLLEEPEAEE